MTIAGIPLEFFLFALTLLGVALFHHQTFYVGLGGMVLIAVYKILFSDFAGTPGVAGLVGLFGHEWVTLANLLCLLLGFALLADHFSRSGFTDLLPKYLPDDWKGGFYLLLIVFVLSAFLDNIAAAMIGGSMAAILYRNKVHIGYLAAIVAASNAGGAGSVVGDTTTTMMWIAGISPLQVLEAYVAAFVAVGIFGVIAARQQHALQPIVKDSPVGAHVDWARLAIVAIILVAAISVNIFFNLRHPTVLGQVPVIGLTVWAAILATAVWRQPTWRLVGESLRGSIFLLSLVMCAAMMPVQHLPAASWQTSLGLGFVSAVFDNIPLTALALRQGGYDWGFLAYAVGFGGSMIWFGSSAGVALCNLYPEGRSVAAWLRNGWHIPIAYVIGYFVLLVVVGWDPEGHAHRDPQAGPAVPASVTPSR